MSKRTSMKDLCSFLETLIGKNVQVYVSSLPRNPFFPPPPHYYFGFEFVETGQEVLFGECECESFPFQLQKDNIVSIEIDDWFAVFNMKFADYITEIRIVLLD
jgi:hypothetical protein